MRRATRRTALRAAPAGAACLLAASLLLGGCEAFFNAILDTGAPTGLSASDGDYADRIELSWSAPSLSSEKWAGYEVDHYDVSWSGPASGSASVTATSFSLPGVTPAMLYSFTVESVLRAPDASTENGGGAHDEGFALQTEDLLWYDAGMAYPVTDTLAGHWYVTMLQEGFSYAFTFDAGAGTGTVSFYDFETLSPLRATVSGTNPSWTCDEAGRGHKFYVHVIPAAAGSFSAQYSF